jgi:hypothetical protein
VRSLRGEGLAPTLLRDDLPYRTKDPRVKVVAELVVAQRVVGLLHVPPQDDVESELEEARAVAAHLVRLGARGARTAEARLPEVAIGGAEIAAQPFVEAVARAEASARDGSRGSRKQPSDDGQAREQGQPSQPPEASRPSLARRGTVSLRRAGARLGRITSSLHRADSSLRANDQGRVAGHPTSGVELAGTDAEARPLGTPTQATPGEVRAAISARLNLRVGQSMLAKTR